MNPQLGGAAVDERAVTRLVCVCAAVWALAAACGGGPSPQARTAALIARLDAFGVEHASPADTQAMYRDGAPQCDAAYREPTSDPTVVRFDRMATDYAGGEDQRAIGDLAVIVTFCPGRVGSYLARLDGLGLSRVVDDVTARRVVDRLRAVKA